MQKHLTWDARNSDIAQASPVVEQTLLAIRATRKLAHVVPNPSYVDVPLPSSSMMTRLDGVAVCILDINAQSAGVLQQGLQQTTQQRPTFKIVAASSISAMNVDTPRNCRSPAPTRARTQSTMDTLPNTKHVRYQRCECTTKESTQHVLR